MLDLCERKRKVFKCKFVCDRCSKEQEVESHSLEAGIIEIQRLGWHCFIVDRYGNDQDLCLECSSEMVAPKEDEPCESW